MSTRSKMKGKSDTNCFKVSNDRFWWKNRPTLAQIISGTKCDRDKHIFSAERGGQYDRVGHKNRD